MAEQEPDSIDTFFVMKYIYYLKFELPVFQVPTMLCVLHHLQNMTPPTSSYWSHGLNCVSHAWGKDRSLAFKTTHGFSVQVAAGTDAVLVLAVGGSSGSVSDESGWRFAVLTPVPTWLWTVSAAWGWAGAALLVAPAVASRTTLGLFDVSLEIDPEEEKKLEILRSFIFKNCQVI